MILILILMILPTNATPTDGGCSTRMLVADELYIQEKPLNNVVNEFGRTVLDNGRMSLVLAKC